MLSHKWHEKQSLTPRRKQPAEFQLVAIHFAASNPFANNWDFGIGLLTGAREFNNVGSASQAKFVVAEPLHGLLLFSATFRSGWQYKLIVFNTPLHFNN